MAESVTSPRTLDFKKELEEEINYKWLSVPVECGKVSLSFSNYTRGDFSHPLWVWIVTPQCALSTDPMSGPNYYYFTQES